MRAKHVDLIYCSIRGVERQVVQKGCEELEAVNRHISRPDPVLENICSAAQVS